MNDDASQLKETALSLLSEMGCDGYVLQEELYDEMCRFGAAEIHVVAAIIGGITSQEVIKVRFISLCLFNWSLQYQRCSIVNLNINLLYGFPMFAAHHEAVCSHVRNLHLQRH